ncbi:MAG: S8 family peptidase, partial [Chloroflexi bacterium]|nr:S8 family peptidase [Chloroflexota bacterium]
MLRKTFNVLSIVLVLVLALTAVVPASANQGNGNGKAKVQEAFSDGIYIVQMIDDPVIAYDGSINGFQATKPEKGQKINPKDGKVVKYVNRLINSHNDALAKAGGGEKFYDYTYSFNGFAAKLTGAQASKVAALPNVVSVRPDEVLHIDTSNSPGFMGMDNSGGIWDQVGGAANAGEDVVVGIVDSGLWPENPSFSDQTDLADRTGSSGKRTQAYGPAPADWYGLCQSGEQWSQDDCNNKVIGARYYLAGYGHYGIVQNDYKSARDSDGHGSHTSGTAAGNYGVPASGEAASLGTLSGMAPRARIAVYKVCWNGDDGGCVTSDSVAAIDQAVADGVDVINFSISGTTTDFLSPVEVAFLFAADAGVFVAASAGNSGPGDSTVAHPSPWLTTVAASTHRSTAGSATLGDSSVYVGVTSSGVGVGPAPLVYAGNVGDALCAPGSLNPALVTGKIVACDRGVYARVDKSYAVQQAGGIGMILMNPSPNSLNSDLHFVPTVHVQDTDRAAILAYISSQGAAATATLSAAFPGAAVPAIAEFSSRGPSSASEDQIKPDISAPGVDVLAAVSPPGNHGRSFDLLSGTSMSSPHIAGLGALMKDAHPDWTPAMIKSAMMTTAYDLVSGADPFAQGAGHVQPNSMADPGLVYDNGFIDWLGFLCGTGQLQASYCSSIGIDPSDLNLASMAIGGLAGNQTITRTVTNVGDDEETYNFSYSGLSGVDVVANPSSFTLAPGASQIFTVTFTVTSAALNTYATGFVYWNGDQGHIVRSPVAVKPVALAAPAEVFGTGAALNFNVVFGYTGDFYTTVNGLVPANTENGFVVDDPSNDINTALASGVGITMHTVNIPVGTTYARFSLFDDFTDGDDDLDMYIFDSN